MSIPPKFTGVSGEIHAHLFENPLAQVPRDLYWACNVEFEPFENDGEEWNCTLHCEWITWPIRSWRELEGISLAQCTQPNRVEASLYFYAQHQWVKRIEVSLRHLDRTRFRLSGSFTADLRDADNRMLNDVLGSFEVDAMFSGVVLVKDNFQSKPNSESAATELLEKFADPGEYTTPAFDRFRWLFAPRF